MRVGREADGRGGVHTCRSGGWDKLRTGHLGRKRAPPRVGRKQLREIGPFEGPM